jgi:creatinine amidohydrolase/Fe(II)-dependent formamide hydrolase-like protein
MGSVHAFEFLSEVTISLRESMLRYPTGGITMRRILAAAVVLAAVLALSETLRSQGGDEREAPPAGLDDPRPIQAVDAVFTEEMTWMEVRDAIRAGKTTAIVATGGLEQNGPHVATGKHNFVLRSTTEAIARKLGNALVSPIVPFVPEGSIDPPSGHMWYAGTISLREETFQALLRDVCASLKQHGFLDIVLIGDSGGNARGMQATADSLNEKWRNGPTRVSRRRVLRAGHLELRRAETHGHRAATGRESATRDAVHTDFHYESMVALVDPKHIRMDERIRAGRFEVYGVELGPLEKTLAAARHLVDYRADITVEAIRKAMAAAGR